MGRQNVQMVDAHWQKISKEAKDLISQLLIKNPAQRITCENAMKHEWFEPIREEQQSMLLKHNENKLIIIDEQMKNEQNKNNKTIELYPDETGTQSVKDIKVYSEEAKVDDEEDDDDESQSDDDDSAPINILRQKSVQKHHAL